MIALAVMIGVVCQKCGRKHCDATLGARIRFRCKRCGLLQIVDVE